MAVNSIVTKVGDGVTTDFTFSFTGGYMDEDHVFCHVNAEVDGAGDPVYRTITFLSAGTIQVGGAVPAIGEQVKIFRQTPIITAINDFSNGTVLDAETLDRGFEQLVKAAQELEDGLNDAVSAKASAEAAAASALDALTLANSIATAAQTATDESTAASASAIAAAASAVTAATEAAKFAIFPDRASFEAATIGSLTAWSILINGEVCHFAYDPVGTAITSDDGKNGKPATPHFSENYFATRSAFDAYCDTRPFPTPYYIPGQAESLDMGFFGIIPNVGLLDDAKWADALEALNTGRTHNVHHTGGTSTIAGSVGSLTGPGGPGVKDHLSLTGIAGASRIDVSALTDGGAGNTNGTFIQLGDTATSDYLMNASIKGLTFNFLNTTTIDHTQALFEAQRGNTVNIEAIRGEGMARLINADLFSKLILDDVNINIGERGCAYADAYLYFEKTVSTMISRVNLAGFFPSNLNAAGAMVKFAPKAGDNIDTVRIWNSSFQSFSIANDVLTADGKPYGLWINTVDSDSSATNWWINNCVFDHTTLNALLFESDALSDTRSRFFDVGMSRFTCDTGKGIVVKRNGTGTTTNMRLHGNFVTVKDDNPAVSIVGDLFKNCSLDHNSIMDRNGATPKAAGVSINVTGGGWICDTNRFGNDDDGVTPTGFLSTYDYHGKAAEVVEIGTFAPEIDLPTFVPTLTAQTVNSMTVVYGAREGTVVRMGNIAFVTVSMKATPSWSGTAPAGDLRIKGIDDLDLSFASSPTTSAALGEQSGLPTGDLTVRTIGTSSWKLFKGASDVDMSEITSGVEVEINFTMMILIP